MNKQTLAEKIIGKGDWNDTPNGFVKTKDAKEKIQNAQGRIIEVINMEWSKGMEHILNEVREIFFEEFGEGILK